MFRKIINIIVLYTFTVTQIAWADPVQQMPRVPEPQFPEAPKAKPQDFGSFKADPLASKQNAPAFDRSANGVPVINIAPPSPSGLSHNKYDTFNVGQSGVIVNNSVAMGETKLGGWVHGNERLAGHNPARVILQEVTSNNPSEIRGPTEIFGKKADYVVANPNGISINNGSFINAGNVTLSTGRAHILDDGRLQLQVRQGEIAVDRGGVDLTDLDRFDLVSRRVTFDGKIRGRTQKDGRETTVNVRTGAQDYTPDDQQSTLVDDGANSPRVAIDSTVFGGISAGRIALISTDKGTGVRAPENMASRSEDIEITADGDIVLKNSAALKNIKATSTSGKVRQDAGGFSHAGTAIALDGKSVDNAGTLNAPTINTKAAEKTENTGKIQGTSIEITSKDLDNSGTIGADQRVKLTIAKTLDNSGTIQSNGRVDAVADKLMNRGTITSLKEMNLTGSNLLRNNQGGLIQSKGTLTLNGTILSNAGRLAGHATVILANNITNAVGGEILSQTTLMCDGDNLSNSGVISSKKSMLVKLHNSFTNQGYILGHGLEFQVNNKFLNTYAIQQDGSKRRGEILSSGSILIKGRTQAKTQFVENHSSLIQATGGGIHIHADQFRNYRNPAKIIWKKIGNSSWIQKWQMIESQDDAAEILANGKITINAVTALNEYSLISGVGDIHMVGTKLENTAQHLIQEFYRRQDPPSKKKRRGGVRGALGSKKKVTLGHGGFVLSRTQVRETIPARIEAGGKFTGSFTDRLRQADSGIKENTAPEINPQTMRAHHVPNLEKLAQQAAASPLFQTSPADSPYFIETHPDFVDLGKYAGSPHFRARTEPYRGRPDAPKLYGDSFVMHREIMRQIHDLTGSHLLGTNLTSDQLIELLFTQGDEAEKDLALTPEITLTKDQVARLRRSIIRFEKRTINGVDVLYPQVYLSAQDLMKLGGKGASIAALETLIQAPTVENSGTIEGFVKNQLKADHLFQQGGVIDGGETTVTVDDLVNLSGVIAGDTTTVRAGQVHSETLVKTHAHAHGYTGEAQRRAAFIARKGKLDIDVTGDYTAIGTQHSGAGGIDLEIGGQRHLDAAEVSSHSHSSNRRGSHTHDSVRNVKTTFDSGVGTDVGIHSVGAAFDRGIDIAAGRHTSKTSDGETLEQSVVDSDYQETTYQKKSHGKKRVQKSSHQSARVNRNRYTGSGDLDLHSQGNHTLGPIHARIGGKARISSKGGKMHMAGQKSLEAHSSDKKSEDKFWKSTSSYGRVDEHLEQSQIHAAGGTEITGGKGVVIDRAREKHSHANGDENKGKPQTYEFTRNDSNVPGQEWMKTPGATFNTVDELHQSWEFRNQGMGVATQAIVAIAATLCTMGAGGFFAAGGAAAAGGTASAGTATLASTLSSVASGAVAGAKAALMSTFTTHLINERANLGNVGRKMASKDTAKSVGFGAATGGLMAGAEHVSGISTTQMQGFRQQVQGNAVKFAVNSGVRMAFGEKPRNVLKSGAANFAADVVAGLASNEISDWRQGSIGNGSLFDYTLHKGLHFATGAATRGGAEALMGGNSSAIHRAALSGGMGAATAEILGEKLALDALRSGRMHEGNTSEMMGHITALSSQTAGLGAALTGLDVSHAQHAGSVAVENNTAQLAFILAARSAKVAGDMANEDDGDIAAEAREQWYGQKREAVLEAVTPEVAREFAESAADYAQLMQGGPEAYADARLQGIQAPRVREQLRSEYESDYFEDQYAFNMMAGIGLATEAAGKVIEFGSRVLGADRGTARNIRHGVDDATLVSGGIGLGLAKTGAKLTARTAGKVGRAGVKATKDVPVSEGKAAKDSFKTQAKNVETKETKPNGGRGKNYLKPDEKAEGDHTVFRSDKDGGVFKYETYKQNPKNPTGFDSSKRVDMTGDPHFNKKTGENVSVPHVQSKDIPGGVRPANPTEIPKSFAE